MARLTFISRMTVKPGREEEFVRVCKELTAKVLANETPIFYEFFKLREPRRYAVLESFSERGGRARAHGDAVARRARARHHRLRRRHWEREYLDPFEA